ncbi:unnamed protein product [Rotaria magnacalcarata]|uniref:Uncharacterized protein n=1 Tax=Rotaria magnacalcarata TaxID=392030 RepID=A0A8S3BHX9_9BILA|nr:unnamed protein product [Rotaria magnacalcarata]
MHRQVRVVVHVLRALGQEVIVKLVSLYPIDRVQSDELFLLCACIFLALCPNCNYNCGRGYCSSVSSCYCNSGYQGTCCNSTITSGQCLSLSPMSTTSWGNGFNNTFYGYEHDVVNVSCSTGKALTVAACFYGINSANPGCGGSTVSANCLSMDVSSTCATLCNSSYCYFAVDNTNFGDTCFGLLKTFWIANPGCGGSTVSANCLSMDVSSTCTTLCNSSYCYFAVENTNFGDTCFGLLKTFWMYFTCA